MDILAKSDSLREGDRLYDKELYQAALLVFEKGKQRSKGKDPEHNELLFKLDSEGVKADYLYLILHWLAALVLEQNTMRSISKSVGNRIILEEIFSKNNSVSIMYKIVSKATYVKNRQFVSFDAIGTTLYISVYVFRGVLLSGVLERVTAAYQTFDRGLIRLLIAAAFVLCCDAGVAMVQGQRLTRRTEGRSETGSRRSCRRPRDCL